MPCNDDRYYSEVLFFLQGKIKALHMRGLDLMKKGAFDFLPPIPEAPPINLESWRTLDPLLCAQSGRRLSKRRVQFAWRQWQRKAEFDRLYPFHAIRHSAVTNVYRATRDLFLAQRFARHASPWVGGRRGARVA